ncbi:sugar phosphate isomerase/epimerase [Bacillaceae bacterium SIJ1]|nr:sugar phosphate isomerase/epimerase [Litoribacterium kuwaitense]
MAWWTLSGMGDEAGEWSDEEKIKRVAEDGFTGINGFLPPPEKASQWQEWMEQHSLTFSINAYPTNAHDMEAFLDKALEYSGDISLINAQVKAPFCTGEHAIALLDRIHTLSRQAKLPVLVETHRGTITQDLLRTVEYVERLPDLPLTIDFSHYVLTGEMHVVSQEAEVYFQRLLQQTECIHGRISNGEQIQVRLNADGGHERLNDFSHWWQSGMRAWRTRHSSGCFPFVCELGPPPYALVDEATDEKAIRWKQSLQLADIARRLWKDIDEEVSVSV